MYRAISTYDMENDERNAILIKNKPGIIGILAILGIIWVLLKEVNFLWMLSVMILFLLTTVLFNFKTVIAGNNYITLSYPLLKREWKIPYENLDEMNIKEFFYSRQGEKLDLNFIYKTNGKKRKFTIGLIEIEKLKLLTTTLSKKGVKITSNNNDLLKK